MIETKLYKRAANGEPQEWFIRMADKGDTDIGVGYGRVDGKTHTESIPVTMKDCKKEFDSRVAAKKKEGYMELIELYDNAPRFVEGWTLYTYLNTYLPKFNVSSSGQTLCMLCKTLENNKIFEKYGVYRGQWKINGLRCNIGAVKSDDMFEPIKFTFTSREGVRWELPYLAERLRPYISTDLLEMMIEEGAYLDGEVYIPGYSVNEINSFVKNPLTPQHKELQFWCYDIGIQSMSYHDRRLVLLENFDKFIPNWNNQNDHLNNKDTLILLPEINVSDYISAVAVRDSFIDLGFEGLILRNPNMEYGFGKRSVGLMHKFKKVFDGKFAIIDIVPEGKKRTDLGKFILRNDINNELFECTYNASQDAQKNILALKDKFIGKFALVEYRERSGVKEVPFHAKAVKILI